MKITDRLRNEHEEIRACMKELDLLAGLAPQRWDADQLEALARKLVSVLDPHARLEDASFYPAVQMAVESHPAPPFGMAYLHHLDDEHQTLDRYAASLVQELSARPIAFTWPQTFALLSTGLDVHMRREERELFPAAETIIDAATLEKLG